jgi:hypothetical protein
VNGPPRGLASWPSVAPPAFWPGTYYPVTEPPNLHALTRPAPRSRRHTDRLWRDGRGQWSLRSVITGWDQVALPSAARRSRNELISGCKHPASNALGCRNRDCDAGVVSPFLEVAPTPAQVVRLHRRSGPGREEQTVISLLVPAPSRSSAWRSACSFSAFRQKSGSGTVRDGSSVFGTNRSCPPARWSLHDFECSGRHPPAARVVQAVCVLCFRAAARYRAPSRQAAFAVG